ncbi:MAG: acyl-CoA dehydrogenase family protein [Candidatus Schekmanbacteria bacterium]|nr:acyl-CoA dehydrogenase family protein [Candidatus Schekmanbacteria bacterium]
MSGSTAPGEARARLGALGRLLYDVRPLTLWERDTETLSWHLRRYRRRCRRFAESYLAPRALQMDRRPDHAVCVELFLESARWRFQTELLPWPLGSGSLKAMAHSFLFPAALKAEELCAACGGLGLALLAHDLGIAPLFVSGDLRAILRWQRAIYDEIRAGEPAIAAFAITEPGAGSDAEDTEGAASARPTTVARRAAGGFRLSGRKCFISNGGIARWVTLFAAVDGGGFDSWTCFLLDQTMTGFQVGRAERKLGQRAADASELVLDDVFVPEARVIGHVGGGWAINRNVLNFSRPIVGAIAVGIARGALERAVAFCETTRLAARPLTAYQDIRLKLAEMTAKVQAGRALVWQAVRYRLPFQASGSIAKSFCGDMAWEVCTEAMALLGEQGYLRQHGVEKAARDARLTQIYEGTNQINRLAVFEGLAESDFAPRPTRRPVS